MAIASQPYGLALLLRRLLASTSVLLLLLTMEGVFKDHRLVASTDVGNNGGGMYDRISEIQLLMMHT